MAQREFVLRKSMSHRFAVHLIVLVTCLIVSPFGTSVETTFWDLVVYWVLAIIAVGAVVELCVVTMFEARVLNQLNGWFRILIGAVLGGLPGTAFIIFLNSVLRADHTGSAIFPYLWIKITGMTLIIVTVEVLVASSGRLKLTRDIEDSARSVDTDPEHSEPSQELFVAEPPAASEAFESPSFSLPRLNQRLSQPLRNAPIVSLSMQDHYVEVTTTQGSDMLLMRLSDAIALLDNVEGVQTHRSHWAARKYITSLSRDGRRHKLMLKDGKSVPVSNSFLGDVQAILAKSVGQGSK